MAIKEFAYCFVSNFYALDGNPPPDDQFTTANLCYDFTGYEPGQAVIEYWGYYQLHLGYPTVTLGWVSAGSGLAFYQRILEDWEVAVSGVEHLRCYFVWKNIETGQWEYWSGFMEEPTQEDFIAGGDIVKSFKVSFSRCNFHRNGHSSAPGPHRFFRNITAGDTIYKMGQGKYSTSENWHQ